MIIPLPPSLGVFKRPSSNGVHQVRNEQARMLVALRVDEGNDGASVREILTVNLETFTMAWEPFDSENTGVGMLMATPVGPQVHRVQ